MTALPFACRCGCLKGTLSITTPHAGNHVRCFCASCRAAMIYTGAPDPKDGGVVLYQTTPDRIRLTHGADQLAVYSFTPTKLLRWQAACCGTALGTTLPSPRFALFAIMTNLLTDPAPLGPERMQAFVPQADGSSKHSSVLRLYGGTIWRAAVARMTGRWRQTPFFDVGTSKTVAPVKTVDLDSVLPRD